MNLIQLTVTVLMISNYEFSVNGQLNDRCGNVKTPLNVLRKRRHLTFPEGSALVMTLSVAKTIMVHVPSGWNFAMEVDIIFPLLNPEMTNAFFKKKIHNRQKREFWQKMQDTQDRYNFNGRACIYKSICEARTHLAPPGKSLVHDILRSIFSAPVHEEGFKEEVNDIYDELSDPNVCDRVHDCPVSLLQVILGLNKNG